MNDQDCVRLLQWALPRLGHRWEGYRRVRRQVCRRIDARIGSLGLADVAAYRHLLETERSEWAALRACLRVTISRFFRNRGVFQALADSVLPTLAESAAQRDERVLRVWSAGCASGEEPYSLSLLWAFQLQARHPGITVSILATDADTQVLERAEAACYPTSSLRELPPQWRDQAFTRANGRYCLHPELRRGVRFEQQDMSSVLPDGPFQLILCRNLAFTYFDPALQRRIASDLLQRLAPGGFLVLGVHEHLPAGIEGVLPWAGAPAIYHKPSAVRAA